MWKEEILEMYEMQVYDKLKLEGNMSKVSTFTTSSLDNLYRPTEFSSNIM